MPEKLLVMKDITYEMNNKISMSHMNFVLEQGECHAVVGIAPSELQGFQSLVIDSNIFYNGTFLIMGKQRRNNDFENDYPVITVNDKQNIFTTMTIAQNLFVNRKDIFHMPGKKAMQKAAEIFDEFEIDYNLQQKVEDLTLEEGKILEVVRAYISDKPIVLFNDTLLYLGKYLFAFNKILARLKERKAGIVYITSRIEDALKIADKVSVLDKGTIRQTFNREEIIQKPRRLIYYLSGWEVLYNSSMKESYELIDTIYDARDLMSTGAEVTRVLRMLVKNIEMILDSYDVEILFWDKDIGEVVETICHKEKPIFKLPAEFFEKNVSKDFFSLEGDELSSYLGEFSDIHYVYYKTVKINNHLTSIIQISYKQKKEYTEIQKKYLITFSKEIAVTIEMAKQRERSVILQESHHRIKNNLQMIINLLYLQKSGFSKDTDVSVTESFDAVIGRVKSVALVHTLLTRNEFGNSVTQLRKLVKEVIKFYVMDDVEIIMDIIDIAIPYNKAVSIAMLINEMISNCVKHAFTGRTVKKIWISAQITGENMMLSIRDNGVGFPELFKIEECDSLGMEIMRSIIQGMSGQMKYGNCEGAFVHFVISKKIFYV